MNNVSVIGRLTKDIELRYTPQGKAVATISLAINEKYGEKKQTHFINAELWGKTAEIASQYLHKGNRVGLTGSLKQHRWEDKNGQKRSTIVILVNKLHFLENKKSAADTANTADESEFNAEG